MSQNQARMSPPLSVDGPPQDSGGANMGAMAAMMLREDFNLEQASARSFLQDGGMFCGCSGEVPSILVSGIELSRLLGDTRRVVRANASLKRALLLFVFAIFQVQ